MKCAQLGRRLAGSALVLALSLTTAPGAWADSAYEVLYTFTGAADGGLPGFGLALDSSGNLYGVTFGGGPECKSKNYCGIVFQLMRLSDGKWEEKVLHGFTAWGDGDGPNGGPAIDAVSRLADFRVNRECPVSKSVLCVHRICWVLGANSQGEAIGCSASIRPHGGNCSPPPAT